MLDTDSTEPDMLDYGQAVGARVRLLKSNVVGEGSSNSGHSLTTKGPTMLPTRYLCMSFLPNDPSRFVVGNDVGHALHRSRYSEATPSPREFEHHYEEASAAVTSLSFCPSQPSYLLIGRADGTAGLYHVDDGRPLLSWQGFTSGGIAQLAWATTRPSVFWALDTLDCIHIFELLEIVGRPTISVPMQPSTSSQAQEHNIEGAKNEALRFALDFSPAVARKTSQRMMASTVKRDGVVAGIEVHVIGEKIASPKKGEDAAFIKLLESL